MNFDGVVFDFDGVIVDSEHIGIDLDRRLLAEHGIRVSADEVAAMFMGKSEEHHVAELRRMIGRPLSTPERTRYDEEYERLFDDVAPVPGVPSALGEVQASMAIASNNGQQRIRRTLDRLDMRSHFDDRIVTRDDVAEGKPAPDVYLQAAELLNLDPARCAAVEDSLTGVRAARSAGLTVFGYVNRHTSREAMRAAGAVPFERMSELPAMLSLGTPGV